VRTSLVCTEYEAIYNKLLVEKVSYDGVGGVVVLALVCAFSPAVPFLNVNEVPREVVLPVLSPVLPLKLEEGCGFPSR